MKLSKLFGVNQIILEMKAVEHWSAIVELVDQLTIGGGLPQDQRDSVLESLKTREEQVSTGVGCGVAIPHAFSDEIGHVIAALGRSREGIDFQAIDGIPVHFIILFIVPSKHYQLHLQTLAAIAKMFTNIEVRRRLGAAESCEEILAILDPRPSRSPAPGA